MTPRKRLMTPLGVMTRSLGTTDLKKNIETQFFGIVDSNRLIISSAL